VNVNEIEIIFNGIIEKIPENTTIAQLIAMLKKGTWVLLLSETINLYFPNNTRQLLFPKVII
jgi:hypothetical protein